MTDSERAQLLALVEEMRAEGCAWGDSHCQDQIMKWADELAALLPPVGQPARETFTYPRDESGFALCHHGRPIRCDECVAEDERAEAPVGQHANDEEEITRHTFASRTPYEPGDDRDIWCKDCEYHRDHQVHSMPDIPVKDALYLSDLAYDHAAQVRAKSETLEYALRTVAVCGYERAVKAEAPVGQEEPQ